MIEERQWVFCPKCRKETMINARHFRVSVADNKIIV